MLIMMNNGGKRNVLKIVMLRDFRIKKMYPLNNFKVLIAWRKIGKEHENLQRNINSNLNRGEENIKLCFI